MERIKKALERATSERNTQGAKTVPGTRRGGFGVAAHPATFTYTQTRIIKVPKARLRANRLITGFDSGLELDAYKMLRTNVLRAMKANQWTSLAITSSRPGEGKTLTAINLAISMAMEVNHTVLLVDFDLRKPTVHRYFDYVPANGISEYITENIPLESILFNPSVERLVVLPGNKSFTNSSEMLSLPKVVDLVDELKNRYPNRYVIFDLPPLMATDDALVFADYVDTFLLVIGDGETSRDELERVREIMSRTNLLGTVLNKANEGQRREYYTQKLPDGVKA